MSSPLEPQPLASRALETLLEPATAIVLAWIAAVLLVVHSDPLLATLVVLGAGAFVAGLTGVGGAIVMIPLLLYVPPWLGTGRLALHEIAAITMVQVFAAAASGLAGHLREGFVDRRLAVTLGAGMMIGSLAGAIASRWLPPAALQGIFATMAVAGAVMLLTMKVRPEDAAAGAPPWSAVTGFSLALGVGLLAGAVGAGGAFLLIPLMLSVLHIPPRIAVGSSLAIALAGATAGLAGKFISGQVPGWTALALVAGALPSAQLGAVASTRLKSGQLRVVLALLIAAVAIKMWLEILR